MKIRVCHTILFGVCYFLFTPAFTQPLQKIIFKDLNIKNKSLTNVRKIHKDKLGFIWIATQSGVIRTDGTNYINYDNEAISKYKLSAVDIWDIYEDEKLSCIYTLSSSGIIDVINIYSGNVIGRLSVGLFSQDNWFMSISKFGDEFWIAGYQGVFILNEKTKKVTKPDFVKKGIQNQFCRKALQLADGNILIHIGGLGLFVVNPYTKQVLATVENNKLSDNLSTLFVVNDMIIIDSGRVLLATSEGLRIIYHNASRITKVDKAPCNTKQLNTVPIAALENTDNNLLISSNSLFAFNANRICGVVYES